MCTLIDYSACKDILDLPSTSLRFRKIATLNVFAHDRKNDEKS